MLLNGKSMNTRSDLENDGKEIIVEHKMALLESGFLLNMIAIIDSSQFQQLKPISLFSL